MNALRLAALFAALLAFPASAQVTLTDAFPGVRFTSPVELKVAPGQPERVYVVEQGRGLARVMTLQPGDAEATVFLDIDERVLKPGGEEGLTGLAFHPDYAANGRFFVYYTAADPLRTVLSEFARSADDGLAADPSTERVILEIPQPLGNHNGGKMEFGPDGYLYLAVGDGGGAGDPTETGQDPSDLLGSLLRLDVDRPSGGAEYAIPPDNPFVDDPAARDELYAYGFRNPWKFSFDRATGDLWLADVGQDAWEEINLVQAGGNYGWNRVEGPECFQTPCDPSLYEAPVFAYPHSAEEGGFSITGGFVYRGSEVDGLHGLYVYADFILRRLWALRYDPATGDAAPISLSDAIPGESEVHSFNIASVNEGPGGEVYVLNYRDGKVYKLSGTVPASVLLTGAEGYRMLAHPAGGTVDDLLGSTHTQGFPGADEPGRSFCSVYTYDETIGDFAGGYTCATSQSTAIAQGKGFFAYVFADEEPAEAGVQGGFPKILTTTGAAASPPFSDFALTYTDNADRPAFQEGWNLLGNPLATAFDWDAVNVSGGLTNTVYVYDPNYLGGDYRSWTRGMPGGGDLADGVVPAFHGFFAKLAAEPATLEIPADAVVDSGPGVYGKTDAGALRLGLAVVVGESEREVSAAFIGTSEHAALGADVLDAYRLTPGAWPRTVLSTLSPTGIASPEVAEEPVALMMNALPADLAGEMTLPLTIAAEGHAPGSLTLSLAWTGALPEGWRATLVDREAGTRTDLVPGASYAFTLDVPASTKTTAARPAALGLETAVSASLTRPASAAVTTGERFVLHVTPAGLAVSTGETGASELSLSAPVPNPSRGAARIGYAVPEAGEVRLSVYDALGREVAMLADGVRQPGRHEAEIASGLAPGVYVVRLVSGERSVVRRLTVVR